MGIDAIRAFFLPRSPREDQPPRPDPITVAACALLLDIAHADDVSPPRSERASRATSVTRCMFPTTSGRKSSRLAEEERRESVDLFHFTQLLRENLLREKRLRLIEAIWGVVSSDGSPSEVEGHLARRSAELLGTQHPEVQEVKERVAGRHS
jgi:uncharacterized tellurite resistance protein B-like protein